MTARNAMTHRCTIQRDASHSGTVRDEWGGDQPPEWAATTTETVSCRYWYAESATIMDGQRNIITTARMLLLPIDTDVTDDDRIGDITDRRGRVLVEGPMRIDSLGAHERDHLIAKLVRIT
jgi:hypothetical protein